MDRRDFLRSLAAAGALAALPAGRGGAAAVETESGKALAELMKLVTEIDTRYLGPEWNIERAGDVADGHRFLMHALFQGLDMWLEADPARPRWSRIVAPNRKTLGDNPDAVYFSAPVSAKYAYRIRGNLADATYTSFTLEGGNSDGHYPKRVAATLNDTELGAGEDGSYELVLSAKEQPGRWLKLDEDVGTVTTRHYYESLRSVALDPGLHIPLEIEPLGDPGPPPTWDDASIAAGIRRVANFVRGLTIGQPPRKATDQPPFVSLQPNVFRQPVKWEEAEGGFGAVDNAYAMAPYVVMPDQALVIRGRFPRCRFASVVLWNRYLQTYDYAHRRISLNRKQTTLEPDGSFKIVIAHRDPGVPNWIDAEGRPSGVVFWRFQLPEEEVAPLVSKVVPLNRVNAA